MPCSPSTMITLHRDGFAIITSHVLQNANFYSKNSSAAVKLCVYACGFVVTGVGRKAAVALTTLAHSPVVPRVTDE